MKLYFPAFQNNSLKIASSGPVPEVLIMTAHKRDLSVGKSYYVFYCISYLNTTVVQNYFKSSSEWTEKYYPFSGWFSKQIILVSHFEIQNRNDQIPGIW